MGSYIIRRLILLPLTLFAIIVVNFVIINLAPGDPVSLVSLSATGEAQKGDEGFAETTDMQYLQFREHYGLTLPLLFNLWPNIGSEQVQKALVQLATKKKSPSSLEEMSTADYHQLRTKWGDRARYIMPLLLAEAENPALPKEVREVAANLFVRGGTRQGYVGPKLTPKERHVNRIVAKNNALLQRARVTKRDSQQTMQEKIASLSTWYQENEQNYRFQPSFWQKWKIFFVESRFFRYMSRVVTLDFGTLRNDANKTVISEVAKRVKYSLVLAVIPMLVTFALCQIFGMIMAVNHLKWPDISLNILFLILFAIPIFVVAPFLIEKIALGRTLPFSHTPIPYSGFHSPQHIYDTLTSKARLVDVIVHIFLPLVAIMYGTLAVQARLSRTAVLEVLRQDYVRTARAKGLPKKAILIKHVGRNAGITIVTSLAASLGVILGGSLIVETVFEINGFGRFFYDAIRNRDFNVILFSAFAGSFLSLIGYLLADIAYTLLDPRVSLE